MEESFITVKNKHFYTDIKLKILKVIDNEHLFLLQTYVKFNNPTRSVIAKWQRDFTNFKDEGLQPKPMSNFNRNKRK